MLHDVAAARRGRGWYVFVDGLIAHTRVGIHAHEYAAPQRVVVDARLGYRCAPSEAADGWIDYERYCQQVTAFLAEKPHTRLLETLAVEVAALSFTQWPVLETLTLALHKPKIREGTRRIGLELDWTRADYHAWRAEQEAVAARATC
nr:dihydroneopterin aldolase [Trinickia acidisoli]